MKRFRGTGFILDSKTTCRRHAEEKLDRSDVGLHKHNLANNTVGAKTDHEYDELYFTKASKLKESKISPIKCKLFIF
jgi:hypothetical protein